MFIRKPYKKCPHCGQQSFGVLMIRDHLYWRRCASCHYPTPQEPQAKFDLPPLKKKVVYLDQFAISNMAKARVREESGQDIDDRLLVWQALYKKLLRLCQMQLIICPYSQIIEDESLLSKWKKEFQQVFESLSHNTSFHSAESIKAAYLRVAARNWIEGQVYKPVNVDTQSLVNGPLNEWQDWYFISFPIERMDFTIEPTQKSRKVAHQALNDLVAEWQGGERETFDYWYRKELDRLGPAIFEDFYHKCVAESRPGAKNTYLRAIADFYEPIPPSRTYFEAICGELRRSGVSDDLILLKAKEFLYSDAFKLIPFVHLQSLLWAGITWQVRAGGRKRIDEGMPSDINAFSLFYPHCEALLVDKPLHTLIEDSSVSSRIGAGAQIFSLRNIGEFNKFLEAIESQASAQHMDSVREVYGEIRTE